MSFLHPYWLISLLTIPLIVGSVFLSKYWDKASWSKLVSNRLQRTLMIKTNRTTFWLGFGLQITGLLCVILAAARPYDGESKIEVNSSGHNIFFLIDNSRSMLCQDVKPSRMDVAHSQAIKIMRDMPEVRFGLATFAGTMTFVSPYTIDHKTLAEEMRSQKPENSRAGGSDLPRAILTLLSILKETESPAHAVIVFSDGEDHGEEMEQALQLAAEAKVKIFTIGVGTVKGGTIPDITEKDNKFKDNQGNVVYTKLNDSSLKQLAKVTDGTYTNATNGSIRGLEPTLGLMKKQLSKGISYSIPHEKYHYFLLTGFICLIVGSLIKMDFRKLKPALHVVLLFVLLYPTLQGEEKNENAKIMHALFSQGSELRKGREHLEKKQYDEAISALEEACISAKGDKLAELHFSLGEAHFRNKEFIKAQVHFSKALLHNDSKQQANSSHNLANSLFHNYWKDLKPTEDKAFKEHIISQLLKKDSKVTREFLEEAIVQWTDAVEYYDYAYFSDRALIKSQQNSETVKELISQLKQAIEEDIAREKKEKEKKRQEEKEGQEEEKDDG